MLPRQAPESASSPPPQSPWLLRAHPSGSAIPGLDGAIPEQERSCKARSHGCPPPCHLLALAGKGPR